MPIYHSLGSTLVSKEEIIEKRSAMHDLLQQQRTSITFSTGVADLEAAPSLHTPKAGGAKVPFKPIGLGKPLTLRIVSVYPGDLPPKGGFLKKKKRGVMVSSAVKSWQSFDAQPRALNMLKDRAEKKIQISGPAATEEGTPLVFYSPALTDRSLILTFEMAFDNVNEDFFTGIGEVFKTAGGLPIFASAQPYLLAAGVLFNLGGALGNAIFDSRAEFQGTDSLNFDVAGEEVTPEGYAVLSRNELDHRTLNDFYVEDGTLVHKKTQVPYSGEIPYVIFSLDGTEDKGLEKFTATAASAALMKQFYNVREGNSGSAEILTESLKYYNDFRYRNEALKIQEQLNEATTEDEKKRLQDKLEAVLKNIQTSWFKP